jgi:RNA polymerase sigma factor (sigma-70 family)
VGEANIRNRGWVLDQAAFEGLLARFDSDSERAGEKYELIRCAIVKFFECRGCSSPHDLADETINRVARKIAAGAEVAEHSLSSFFYGVARNVYREQLRKPDNLTSHIDSISTLNHPLEDPEESRRRESDRLRSEKRLECLEECIGSLQEADRELILSYYDGAAKIESRKQMAESLGISLNGLRIRVHRIREKLERRITACLRQSAGG